MGRARRCEAGVLFETWVVSELLKARCNQALPPRLSFFRDYAGHEIDVLARFGPDPGRGASATPLPIEVKAGATLPSDAWKGLRHWESLTGAESGRGYVIYGGDEDQERSAGRAVAWRNLPALAASLASV